MVKKLKKSVIPSKVSKPSHPDDFFIVCIGASAGGLEAFKEFLSYLPAETGMAFIFIQHLSPDHKSLLPEILSRMTPIKVKEVKSGVKVEPDNIYVIPPDTSITIEEGKLNLKKRTKHGAPYHPIDIFLTSLAEDQKSRGISVILSGTGSDGAEGSKTLRAEGGISFAQDLKSARYDSMPFHANALDDIDFVMTPKNIALEIASLSKLRHIQLKKSDSGDSSDFEKILLLLKQKVGTDFNQYKPTTIYRRVARRMLLRNLNQLGDYLKILQSDPEEKNKLADDVLINVTHFFRDPETFENLKQTILPKLLSTRSGTFPLRIWVPGCATGEEAYSIAISLIEIMGAEANSSNVQIFATDLSEKCIEKARIGLYQEFIAEHVSKERLSKFFIRTESGAYRISKAVRDLCIFAKHDLSRDPAYSKIDLISCRNLLIYLGQDLQAKVIENFHYSLNPKGYLMLGVSENIGKSIDLFNMVDPKNKIFTRKNVTSHLHTGFRLEANLIKEPLKAPAKKSNYSPTAFELQVETDRAILARFSPASVVINQKMEILQFRGSTEKFLSHKHGEANLNLFKMAREGLANDLKKLVIKAREKDVSVRVDNVQISDNGLINIEIIPLKFLPGPRCFLVTFEASANQFKAGPKAGSRKSPVQLQADASVVSQLKNELSSVKDNLQAVIHDFENANQDLQTANEEIVSTNEELQSTNEELETSKEELQSTNEELSTVNDELQERNQELFRLNNDLANILNSVQIPIIILDNDQNVKRFTPAAMKIFNFIRSDAGRPFAHITSKLIGSGELKAMIESVLEHALLQEKIFHTEDSTFFRVTIRPYKTDSNTIEGVVIVLQSIDMLKSVDLTSSILDKINSPFVILDSDFRIVKANQKFYSAFKLTPKKIEKTLITNIDKNIFQDPKFKKTLNTIKLSSSGEISTQVASKQKSQGYSVVVEKLTDHSTNSSQYLLSLSEGEK